MSSISRLSPEFVNRYLSFVEYITRAENSCLWRRVFYLLNFHLSARTKKAVNERAVYPPPNSVLDLFHKFTIITA